MAKFIDWRWVLVATRKLKTGRVNEVQRGLDWNLLRPGKNWGVYAQLTIFEMRSTIIGIVYDHELFLSCYGMAKSGDILEGLRVLWNSFLHQTWRFLLEDLSDKRVLCSDLFSFLESGLSRCIHYALFIGLALWSIF